MKYDYVIKEGETLKAAAERYGVNYSTFKTRVAKMRAAEKEQQAPEYEYFLYEGESLRKAAERYGISRSTLTRKLHQQGNFHDRVPAAVIRVEEPVEEDNAVYDYLITSAFVTLHRTGSNPAVRTFSSSDPRYKEIEECIANTGDLSVYFNDEKIKEDITFSNATISKDGVHVNGERLDDDFARLVLDCQTGKIDKNSKVAKFVKHLANNPSRDIQNQLYKFMQHNDIDIDKDGMVICYKRVTSKFKDIYTGTFDNSVGKTVSMERSGVTVDPNITCSAGLHVAALSYLPHYTSAKDDVIVEVLVNPEDFVSIPVDYGSAKARVCKYYVNRVYEGK